MCFTFRGFYSCRFDSFLTKRRREKKRRTENGFACVRAAFEKGYEKRSDCAIDGGAMVESKRVSVYWNGREEVKMKVFALILSARLFVWFHDSIFAQISNRIE